MTRCRRAITKVSGHLGGQLLATAEPFSFDPGFKSARCRREALRRDRSPSMIITLDPYFLWFLFYVYVGWMYDSILVSCQRTRLVNEGS